jgi:hypothetical protein
MSRLLVGLGVPHSVVGKIIATPPAKMTFLDNRDLAGLNVRRTNPFRTNHGAASVARHQEAGSICSSGVDVETQVTARAGQSSCTTPRARASAEP